MSKKKLDTIATEILVCPKCGLAKTRKNAVPGEGNPESHVMFIGEAPGYLEDVKGRPFVGDAGKFLDTLISEIGFSRDDIFICNILKCRPPGNRKPLQKEIEACTPYLDRQITLIRPAFIVTLGNYSTAYIFSKANLPFNGITQTRGKFFGMSVFGIQVTVFPTFHPAAALYSEKYREQIVKDFQLLRNELIRKGIVKL